MTFQLAQVNVARLHQPLDHPQIQDFVAGLAPINTLAETSPGFVWRLQDEAGDATSIPYDPDPLLIVNLSVWESVESLRAFSHSGPHLEYLKRRREWFARLGTPHFCMWWIPAGHRPTPAEARERLELLERLAQSEQAFTFSRVYGPPGSSQT